MSDFISVSLARSYVARAGVAARLMLEKPALRTWLDRACVVIAVCILMLRRVDQLRDPQIWVEEGTQILPDTLEHGLGSLLIPVNGYLITISRLVAWLAFKAGGLALYPAFSSALAFAIAIWVLAFVARAPLIVPGGPLLALPVSLVPGSVEIFGVGQYTFWLLGLTLITLVLWQPNEERLAGRIALAVIGGLSSPLCIALTPFAVGRAILVRKRGDWGLAFVFAATAAIQLAFILRIPGTAHAPASLVGTMLALFRALCHPLTLGFVLYPEDALVYVVGVAHGMALATYALRPQARFRRILLLSLFFVTIGSAIVRLNPPTAMHPVAAGPRYFFYPFICLAWFWMDCALTEKGVARALPVLVLGLFLFSTCRYFERHHDHLDWEASVREFRERGRASFPVEYAGAKADAWTVMLERCGAAICKAP